MQCGRSSSDVDQPDHLHSKQMAEEEERTVRDWAAKVLNTDFQSTKELADYINANHLIENTNRQSRLRPVPKSRACSKEKVTDVNMMVYLKKYDLLFTITHY